MDIVDLAQHVLLLLNRADVPYALAGGLALAAHGHPRATRDIDIVIPDAEALAVIDEALVEKGWLNLSEPIEFEDGFTLHRRLWPDGNTMLVLDLLVSPPNLDVLSGRELLDLQGVACWVVSRESLLNMKRIADRPQDRADIATLEGDDGP